MRLATLLHRADVLTAWSPGRPVAANLVFVVFVAALELFARDEVVAAGAAAGEGGRPPLALTLLFAALWLAYPFALHVKLPLIAAANSLGRAGRLAEGRELALLLGGLLLSGLTLLLVIVSLGFDLDHPLAFLWMFGITGHGLAVSSLYLLHLGSPPGRIAWRERWELPADLALMGYVCLAYAWLWEGLMLGGLPGLGARGWRLIPELVAAVILFWIVYFPLQAPFLLGLEGDLEERRGGRWLFRLSCVAATVVGLWPAF